MFADPLPIYKTNPTLTTLNIPRIASNPSVYRVIDGPSEREVRITHSQTNNKGQGIRRRATVAYSLRRTVPAVEGTACCTPSYINIVNGTFTLDFAVNCPLEDVEDVAKSLGNWMAEASGLQVIDKLVAGES